MAVKLFDVHISTEALDGLFNVGRSVFGGRAKLQIKSEDG